MAGDRQAKAHAEDAMDVDEQAKSAQADLSPVQASVIPHGHGSVCSLVKPAKVVASTTPTWSVVAPQKRNTAHGQFAYATWAGCGEHPRDALDLADNLHQWLCQRRCDHHSEPSPPRRWSGLPRFAPALSLESTNSQCATKSMASPMLMIHGYNTPSLSLFSINNNGRSCS